MSDFYDISLPDMKYTRQHSFNVNNKSYIMLFTFNDEVYQLLRDLETANRMRAKSDPLVTVDGVKEYTGKYTYIEYYMSIPDNVETWLSNQIVLPSSIVNLSEEDKVNEIKLRKAVAIELDSIRTQYKVMCRWQFTLFSDSDDVICDGFVEKGAWFMPYRDMSLKFEYDIDYIGFDDITNVTMVVRVN